MSDLKSSRLRQNYAVYTVLPSEAEIVFLLVFELLRIGCSLQQSGSERSCQSYILLLAFLQQIRGSYSIHNKNKSYEINPYRYLRWVLYGLWISLDNLHTQWVWHIFPESFCILFLPWLPQLINPTNVRILFTPTLWKYNRVLVCFNARHHFYLCIGRRPLLTLTSGCINSYPDENENCMKYFEATNLVDGETTTGRVGLIICAVPLHKMHGLVPMCELMMPLYLQEEGIIAPSYVRRVTWFAKGVGDNVGLERLFLLLRVGRLKRQ